MPFVKGHKGIPGPGKPPGNSHATSLAATIRAALACKDTKDPRRRSHLTMLINKQMEKAKLGDCRAAEFLFDRGFGRPRQDLDITSGDLPLQGAPSLTLNFVEVQAKKE